MIGELFNTVLFEPLFNAIVFIYRYIPDLGVSIIILTVIIKFVLYLPSRSSLRSQKQLQKTQPKLREIQEKYKNDREELGRQLMKFYKENKVNPFSSCLPLLIQLPILIALYQAFLAVSRTDPSTHILLSAQLEHLYEPLRSMFSSQSVNPVSLGIMDLSHSKNYILAVITAGVQFWQSSMLMSKQPPKVPGSKDESMTSAMNKQMKYLFPIMTLIFGIQFPAGLTLYWLVSTLFTVGQQYLVFKKDKGDEVLPAVPKP